VDKEQFIEHWVAYTEDLDSRYGAMAGADWLEQYAREAQNVQRAFALAMDDQALQGQAIKLALYTAWYWHESGRADEGLTMLERAIALPLGTREAAELHRLTGMLYFTKGNYPRAIEHAQEALEHGLEIEPAEPPHRYYTLLANALLYAGRYDEAEQYYRMAIDSAQSWQRPIDLSTCRFNLAILMYECKGDFQSARRMLAASFETKPVDDFENALAEETLARVAFLERNFDEAVAHADTALDLLARVGNAEHTLDVAMRQCVYLTLDDNGEGARNLWQRHGRDALGSANPETTAAALEATAALYLATGDLSNAVAVRSRLHAFRSQHHLVVFPVEQRFYEAWDFAARAILGKPAYDRAVASGASMSVNFNSF
jgi:tetratricopeptide (TPR) repeat protein